VANIRAIDIDNTSLVYLKAKGVGEDNDPFVSVFQQEFPDILSFRDASLSITPVQVKAGAVELLAWNIINLNTTCSYVKFYDSLAPAVTVGTTVPKLTLMIPPGNLVVPGVFYMDPSLIAHESFTSGLTVAATSGLADDNNTAVFSPIHINLRYR
jgi:hypothetical protein